MKIRHSEIASEAMFGPKCYQSLPTCSLCSIFWGPAKDSSIKPLGVHDLCHAHSLASLQWSGPQGPPIIVTVHCQKWSPIKAEEPLLHLFVLKRREMAQLVLTKDFPQLAKTTAMCMACHDYACPLPPIPPFSKMDCDTDNMWPKLHDDCIRHQWLKG